MSGPASAMPEATDTVSVLDLGPNLLGFYDGRVAGRRLAGPEPNWLDDGGYALGICSYAIHNGRSAIVYDTHLSPGHGALVRRTLEARGVRDMRVVLSHWHLDHVAGNAAFADCEILAHALTLDALRAQQGAIENGTTFEGPPAIRPLVLPTTTFAGDMVLDVAGLPVRFRSLDIHSRDGVVAILPGDGALLAGDTLEDTVTYVAEPDRLEAHLAELDRLAGWNVGRILPNHGSKGRIAAGGYGPGLIDATRHYLEALLALAARDEDAPVPGLAKVMAADLAAGSVTYFAPYEDVHRLNVAAVRGARKAANSGPAAAG